MCGSCFSIKAEVATPPAGPAACEENDPAPKQKTHILLHSALSLRVLKWKTAF